MTGSNDELEVLGPRATSSRCAAEAAVGASMLNDRSVRGVDPRMERRARRINELKRFLT